MDGAISEAAIQRDASVDADAQRLHELGYEQELNRTLHVLDNAAIGFATISPVVGLFAVAFVGMTLAGPAWIWMLPVALAGQCLLLAVYWELAEEFPLANGAYQWSRRVASPAYGWFNGWVAPLRLRGREHHDRVPRRPLGSGAGRHQTDPRARRRDRRSRR